ncbi:MAG: RDD family protein [Blastocatellia bacterium]|nr:RDD family protein [Blastocatellia bacterium]MDW8255845.1 RDD family protein [Acidobacteriota bacterium]
MAALCPRCQAPQRPTARFCRRCGASLAEPVLVTTSEHIVRTHDGSIGKTEERALTMPWMEEKSGSHANACSSASPLLRLEAFFFDLLLLLGAMLVAVIVAVALQERSSLAELASWSALAAGLVWGVNHLILCSVRGQSVGMAFVGLRLVRADGRPMSWGRSLLRHTIGHGLAWLSLGLGFLWMFVDEQRRGWPDLVSGTRVVEEAFDA